MPLPTSGAYASRTRCVAGATAALFGVASLITACGSNSHASTAANATGSASSVRGQTITVVMEGGSTSTPDIQKLLPEFEKQTGIHVNFDVIPYDNLTSRVLLDFTSKQSSPDVVFDDWVYGSQFAKDGYIQPLTSFENTQTKYLQPSDIYAPYLKVMQVQGQQYGIPIYGETTLLMYNKTIFKKYGIASPPSTMQQLEQDAKTVWTDSHHKVAGITLRGAPGIQSVYIYAGFLRAFGGHWYKNGKPDVNSPAAVTAANFYTQLLHKYGPPGVANFEFSQNQVAFDAGNAAMSIDADGLGALTEDQSQSSVAGQIGYAAVPYSAGISPTGSNTNHSLDVHGLYLSKFSKHPLASWLFMSWAANPQVQIAELSDQPQPGLTATAAIQSPAFKQKYSAFLPEMLNQLKTGNPNYLPSGANSNAMITDVGRALNQLVAGGGSASSALAQAQSQISAP